MSLRLPIHLAVHYLGCVQRTPKGIAMRGAVGPHIESLANHLEKVTVVAYEPPLNPSGYEDLVEFVTQPEHDNITICSLGPKGSWRDYRKRRRYIEQVVGSASREWDALLFRMPNRRADFVFHANRCPRIITMTGGYVVQSVLASRMPRIRKLWTLAAAYRSEFYFRQIARASGLVFVNSEFLLNKYHPSFPNVLLQRSSVRQAKFSYKATDRMLTPCVKFLYAGKLTQSKGLFELIESFALIKQKLLPEAELNLAGLGDGMAEIKKLVIKYGIQDSVKFHSWLPADKPLFDLFRQMDVFLFLSHYESFPKVIWEAMAHSVLVISTSVGALPDVFKDGRDLLFVSIGEVSSVVETVNKLKHNPSLRRRLIQNSYQRAQESTLEHVVDDFMKHLLCRWPELEHLSRSHRVAIKL